MIESNREYKDYRIEYDTEYEEDNIKNFYYIYPPGNNSESHFADVSPYTASNILESYIDWHIEYGWFPSRKQLRDRAGLNIVGPVTVENLEDAKLNLLLSENYDILVEQNDVCLDIVKQQGLICDRCGGRGGTIVRAEGGYLPCFACNDTGIQSYESWIENSCSTV